MTRAFLLFLLLVLLPGAASCADTLRVGVTHLPPYTYQDDAGKWSGMGVELWRQVAEREMVVYRLQKVSTQDDLIDGLQSGRLDVTLGSHISATDEGRVDFLQAYHRSALGLALPPVNSMWTVVKGLFTLQFLYIVAGLSVLLLVVGSAIYFLERKANGEQFGGERSIWQGIGAGFWWAGVTMTTIGYGDKAPTSLPGRAVAMLWMLMALAVTSSLTAAIINATDASSVITFPRDLKEKQVGVITDAPAAQYLASRGQQYETYATPYEGLLALERGNIDVFVHDATSLRHAAQRLEGIGAYVQATDARPEAYAFAVAENSDLYESLNGAVIDLTTTSGWRNIVASYDDGERSSSESN